MTRKRWGISDVEKLAKLFDSGMPDADIAKKMGRSERAITNKRNDLKMSHYSRDTRLTAGESTLGKQHRIAMDALDECCLLARIHGCEETAQTVAVALKRIERCKRTPPSTSSLGSSPPAPSPQPLPSLPAT